MAELRFADRKFNRDAGKRRAVIFDDTEFDPGATLPTSVYTRLEAPGISRAERGRTFHVPYSKFLCTLL